MDETRALIASGVAALVRAATTPLEPFGFGRDLKCVADLTPTLEETDPNTIESLAQDLFHRVTTERGSLVDDPDFGIDARNFLSEATTPRELLSIGGRLSLECLKDDRVAHAVVDATVSRNGRQLDITITVTPEDPALQTFTLVLAVTSASALLLEIRI